MARINEPLKGVISFHGNLMTGVKPTTNKIPVLVLNGEDDTFVSKDEIASFKNRWILRGSVSIYKLSWRNTFFYQSRCRQSEKNTI